jgi:hypothetical protein
VSSTTECVGHSSLHPMRVYITMNDKDTRNIPEKFGFFWGWAMGSPDSVGAERAIDKHAHNVLLHGNVAGLRQHLTLASQSFAFGTAITTTKRTRMKWR